MAATYDSETFLLDKANIQDTMVRMVSERSACFYCYLPSLLASLIPQLINRCTASTQKSLCH